MIQLQFELSFLALLCICTLTFQSVSPLPTNLKILTCPESTSISPCTCEATFNGHQFGIRVICDGPSVTQNDLSKTFSTLRTLNNITSSHWMRVDEFFLTNSLLLNLDLTPLIKTVFGRFSLTYNRSLWSITGPEPEAEPSIQIQHIDLVGCNLANSSTGAIADLLKLSSTSVGYLSLQFSKVTGSAEEREFMMGFSYIKELTTLILHSNEINRLEGGQFKSQHELTTFNLEYNRIEELGDGAFLLDFSQYPAPMILIKLKGNFLTDGGITSQALMGTNRITTIDFTNNQFEFISQENFKEYLDATHFHGSQNHLIMDGNQWICDERMKWLKDGRESYESRVQGILCTNDPGETIFTTNLV